MPRSILPRPTVAGATVEIRTSLALELISAVVSLSRREKATGAWVADATGALGQDMVDEIVGLCRPLRWGTDLLELAAEAPEGNDAEKFIAFVEALSDHELTYYLLGRMYTPDNLPKEVSSASVIELLGSTNTADSIYHEGADFSWANDVSGTRKRIVSILRSVWRGYLRDHMPALREQWKTKVAELSTYLETRGAPALWHLVADIDGLPMEIPAGMPYELITFVPSCLTSFGHNYLFGYGKIHVIFNCETSLQTEEDTRTLAEDTLVELKALADRNRLRLLRIIANGKHRVNGKQMAEVLKLSPSVVSRHLAQLRNAGFIEEHTADNRNITYSLCTESVERLSASILEYVSRKPH